MRGFCAGPLNHAARASDAAIVRSQPVIFGTTKLPRNRTTARALILRMAGVVALILVSSSAIKARSCNLWHSAFAKRSYIETGNDREQKSSGRDRDFGK